MEDSAVPAPPPPSLAEIVARRDTALCDIEMSLTDAVDALGCSGRTAAVPWLVILGILGIVVYNHYNGII